MRTAVGAHMRLRRSVQRFERNTYHGDALPTELTGPIFSYLTWGLCFPVTRAGRAQRWYSVESSTSARPHHTPPALESLAYFCRPGVSTSRRPTSLRGRSRAYTDDGALFVSFLACQGMPAIVSRDALPVPSAAL